MVKSIIFKESLGRYCGIELIENSNYKMSDEKKMAWMKSESTLEEIKAAFKTMKPEEKNTHFKIFKMN